MSSRGALDFLSFSEGAKGLERVRYYLEGYARARLPRKIAQARAVWLAKRFSELQPNDPLRDRVAYYCRLTSKFDAVGPRLKETKKGRSRYFIDFMRHARGFNPDFRSDVFFGDIRHVPKVPTFVKSRPIRDDNAHSVLLPLNVHRHFLSVKDVIPFKDKIAGAVWRGTINTPARAELIKRHSSNPKHDIGFTAGTVPDYAPSGFLSINDQIRRQVILSVEGYDVATNLKWAMSSNSLVVSPRMTCETWYMEGRLQPGVHFVELKPDFSDLDDAVGYYARHVDQAEGIIANAQAWRAQFEDQATEDMLAAEVMRRYFVASGQMTDAVA